MTTKYIQPGDVLELVAESGGVTVDVPILYGAILVLPLHTAAVGVEFSAQVTGVWDLDKTSAQAWTEGEKVYWDDGNDRCDTDSTVGPLIGFSAVIAANPTSTAFVRMNGTAPDIAEGPQAAIVTLTDSTGEGAHNDTVADGLTATAPASITDYAAVSNMTDPVTKAEGETFSAAMAVLENEVTALRATVNTLVTDIAVQNQNDSDMTQKVIEILAAMVNAGIIDA